MDRNLLVIGDLSDSSAIRFVQCQDLLRRRKVKVSYRTYQDVLHTKLPLIPTRKLTIMMFFPFSWWDDNIERYDKDNRIYGDYNFGSDFHAFMRRISRMIKKFYQNKSIEYINPPESCVLDRDKRSTSRKLKRNGILTPPSYRFRKLTELKKVLAEGKTLYVKAPFGSMGKGLSLVDQNKCVTNFIYRNGKIKSHRYDYNWDQVKISSSHKDRFLSLLIKKDFIFEEKIEHAVYRRRRFDIRCYVIYRRTPYFYARSAPVRKYLTNWSQGGRIEKGAFLKKALPPGKIKEVLTTARRVAEILKLNYTGVDILFSKDLEKIYVLEAHSFPGYERGFDLMPYLARRL